MEEEVEFHVVVKGGAARQECQACKSGGQRRKGLEVVNILFNLSKKACPKRQMSKKANNTHNPKRHRSAALQDAAASSHHPLLSFG